MAQNRFAVLIGFLLIASAVFAQQNDVAVSFGAILSPGVSEPRVCEALPTCSTAPVDHTFGPAFSMEGTYAHRLANFKVASLHLEVPILFAPSRTADSIVGSSDFSTFFLAPALKVKFLPSSGISPFVSAGGGFARFKEGSTTANGGVFQVGGGLDFKTRLPLLGFRLEVRDFITGRPGIPSFSSVSSDHLHNVFAGGGITLHF